MTSQSMEVGIEGRIRIAPLQEGSGKYTEMKVTENQTGKSDKLKQYLQRNSLILWDDPLIAALDLMDQNQASRTFISNKTGKIFGVITFKDIALYLINEEAEQKLWIRKDVEEEVNNYMIVDEI